MSKLKKKENTIKPDIVEPKGRWKWMREVSATDLETVEYYEELARINEWKLVPNLGKCSFDAYVWIES